MGGPKDSLLVIREAIDKDGKHGEFGKGGADGIQDKLVVRGWPISYLLLTKDQGQGVKGKANVPMECIYLQNKCKGHTRVLHRIYTCFA